MDTYILHIYERIGCFVNVETTNTDTSSTFIYRQFEQGDSGRMVMAIMSIGITSIILFILETYQRKKKL